MVEDLTIYHKKRKTRNSFEDEYVMSKPKSANASDFFLFLPDKRSIESIEDALEYIKNNRDLKKIDGLPEKHRKILVDVLTSIKRAQLLDNMENTSQPNIGNQKVK